MDIIDEKFEKTFMLLWFRMSDRRWFVFETVFQYYVKVIGEDNRPSNWIKCPGRFYTGEEMVAMQLKGDKLYLKED